MSEPEINHAMHSVEGYKMKSLITFSSKSGNTRKLAEAIENVLPGVSVLKPIEENPNIEGFDIIFVGFWLQAGLADNQASAYLKRLNGAKPLFLFATHGAATDSDHARKGMELARDLVSSPEVIGTFSCQGEVKAEFLAKAKTMKPLPPWVEDAANAVGHPDEGDLDRLRETVMDAIKMVSSLHS